MFRYQLNDTKNMEKEAFTNLTNRIEDNLWRTADVNSILYHVQEKF